MEKSVPESVEVKRYRAAVLEGRVRRRLRKLMLVLHKSRGKKQAQLLGRYWITDHFNVMPIQHHVDLSTLAARIGVWCSDLNLK